MSTPDALIFVIVPVFGNWDDTLQCLAALESQSATNFQILIADDGSDTPPPAAIHHFSRARYIRYENAGFGANCNRAAREAIAAGATHLLFLNSDTTFGPRFMEQWIRRVREIPGGIMSPLIYWAHNPGQVWSSGGKLTVFTPFCRSRASYGAVTEVDTVTGCAILVPVDGWNALGGFDPRYTTYFEDFDLTLRAKTIGIRTYVLPDPELNVLHHVSGSFRNTVWRKHYLMLESSLIFIRSHYRGVPRTICFVLSAAHLAITAIRSLPKLPRPRLLWRAIARGLSA